MPLKKEKRTTVLKYLLTLILLVSSTSALARQVTVTVAGSSAQNSPGEYSLEESRVEVSGSSLTISGSNTPVQITSVQTIAISPKDKLLGVLRSGEVLQIQVYDKEGREVKKQDLEFFNPDDQSLEIKQFDDGRSVVRDNIANFTFFEADGKQLYNISNSTQSEAGEMISEMKSDVYGRTILLYNPQIRYGNETGSRARIVHGSTDVTTIAESRQRIISFASVSETGKFITLISKLEGSDDEVSLFDRFGNDLGGLTSEEDLVGAVLSDDGEYLTIYSQYRVQVYRVTDQERIGSTSLQTEVLTASYQSDDDQIIVVTGDSGNTGILTDGQIYAIDIGERSLGNDNIPGTLTFLESGDIRIERAGASRFRVHGFNRELEVETSF